MSAHHFFFPFVHENCVVKKYQENFFDRMSDLIEGKGPKTTDWSRNMLGYDKKGVLAFCLDSYWLLDGRTLDKDNANVVIGAKMKFFHCKTSVSDRLEMLNKVSNPSNHTLYIVGHSSAGSKSISSPDEKKLCHAEDLVKYLAPLNANWSGRIKIMACCGAFPPDMIAQKSQSFAKRFLDEARDKGKNWTVFGYTHNIVNRARLDPSGKTQEFHKYGLQTNDRNSKFLVRVQ